MKFKIGQKVKIASRDTILNLQGKKLHGGYGSDMPQHAGKIYTIDKIGNPTERYPHAGYILKENGHYIWDERLLEEVIPKVELPEDLFKL